MKEMDRQNELDQTYIDFINALEDYAEADFDKDFWDVEVQHSKYVTLTYSDAYTHEEIWFEVIKTYNLEGQDKKTAYIEIDMVQADLDNEIPNPSADVQDDNLSDEVREMNVDQWFEYADQIETRAEVQKQRWLDTKPLSSSVLNEALEISPATQHIECYNNITHTHQYEATNIKARIYTDINLTELKNFLKTRHLIYPLLISTLYQ